MAGPLDDVVRDLAEEQAALRTVLESIPFVRWEKPTHAPGWAIRDQVAHLAQFDDAARLGIVDPERFAADAKKARGVPAAGGEAAYLLEARARPVAGILGWWQRASAELVEAARTLDAQRRMPWYGPPMSATSFITARLMECWSHGLDVVDVAGISRPATDRLRHIAFLGVRTRNFSYVTRGLEPNSEPVRVELTAPSGEVWVFGEAGGENTITGPAVDFCQVVTQRRHVADTALTVSGDAAAEWMLFAQAFAGPPGAGRQPGQFSGGAGRP
jgi:uncharacterized protein (TIGR03084 family)